VKGSLNHKSHYLKMVTKKEAVTLLRLPLLLFDLHGANPKILQNINFGVSSEILNFRLKKPYFIA
jgi:hypothetical protein